MVRQTKSQKNLFAISDAAIDLRTKLIPLKAISALRDSAPSVLEESETADFEIKQWAEVEKIIDEIDTLSNI